jgi:hypothetical protein
LKELTPAIHKAAGGRCAIEIDVRGEDPRSGAKQDGSARAKSDGDVDDVESESDFIDIEEVKALPNVSATSATDELTAMFPGSEIISEDL